MVVKFHVEVFWVVMPCNVVGYQCFRGPCCLHLHPEGGGSMDVGIVPQYMASQPRRLQLKVLHHCLIEHHAMKMYWGSVSIAPRILDLDTKWR